MTSSRLSLASILTFGLLTILGAFFLFQATPEGLGLSDDSIAYIAGARSLLAGDGYRAAWLESNRPVTHFPPAFSGTLALLGSMGLDPINGARLVNTLLFGVNAALMGLLGWKMTKSSLAGIVAAALFIVNDSLLRVHAVAMSEPLFLFFSLLASICGIVLVRLRANAAPVAAHDLERVRQLLLVQAAREVGGDGRAAHAAHGQPRRRAGRRRPGPLGQPRQRLADLRGDAGDAGRHAEAVALAVGRVEQTAHAGLPRRPWLRGSSASMWRRSTSLTSSAVGWARASAASARAAS